MSIKVFLSAIIALFLIRMGVSAQSMTLTGTTLGGETAIFPKFGSTSSSCELNTFSPTLEPFRLHTIVCDRDAVITISVETPISNAPNTDDTGLFWYQGSFNKSAACTNFRAISHHNVGQNMTFNVTANTIYYLAIVGLYGSTTGYTVKLTPSVGSLSATIPVELRDFHGYTEGKNNTLNWQTATENGTSHFEIEHSIDGLKFNSIGSIKAKGTNAEYQFVDKNVQNKLNYYRLKINDLNLYFEYSKTIALYSDKKLKVNLYPSVVTDNLTIEGVKSFQIFNTIGQLVMAQKTSNLLASVNTSALSKGIYLVKGISEEGEFFIEKIIKE